MGNYAQALRKGNGDEKEKIRLAAKDQFGRCDEPEKL